MKVNLGGTFPLVFVLVLVLAVSLFAVIQNAGLTSATEKICYEYSDGSNDPVCVNPVDNDDPPSTTHESVINPLLCYKDGHFYPKGFC